MFVLLSLSLSRMNSNYLVHYSWNYSVRVTACDRCFRKTARTQLHIKILFRQTYSVCVFLTTRKKTTCKIIWVFFNSTWRIWLHSFLPWNIYGWLLRMGAIYRREGIPCLRYCLWVGFVGVCIILIYLIMYLLFLFLDFYFLERRNCLNYLILCLSLSLFSLSMIPVCVMSVRRKNMSFYQKNRRILLLYLVNFPPLYYPPFVFSLHFFKKTKKHLQILEWRKTKIYLNYVY